MEKLPSYRRHSRGYARATLHGVDYLLGKFGSEESKQAYRRLIIQYLEGTLPAQQPKPSANRPLSIALDAFEAYCDEYYKNSKEPQSFRTALAPVRELCSTIECSDFDVEHFKTVRTYLSRNDVTRNYVNKCMSRIIAFVKWCVSESYVPPDRLVKLKTVPPLKFGRTEPRESGDVLPVEDSVVDRTLEFLPPVVADMVRFQRLVGCRPGELCSITPSW